MVEEPSFTAVEQDCEDDLDENAAAQGGVGPSGSNEVPGGSEGFSSSDNSGVDGAERCAVGLAEGSDVGIGVL